MYVRGVRLQRRKLNWPSANEKRVGLLLSKAYDINFIPEKFLVLREGCEVHFLVLVQLLVGNFLLLDEVIEFLHLLVGIELVVYVLRVAEKLRLLLLQRRAGIRLQVRLPNQHIWLRS